MNPYQSAFKIMNESMTWTKICRLRDLSDFLVLEGHPDQWMLELHQDPTWQESTVVIGQMCTRIVAFFPVPNHDPIKAADAADMATNFAACYEVMKNNPRSNNETDGMEFTLGQMFKGEPIPTNPILQPPTNLPDLPPYEFGARDVFDAVIAMVKPGETLRIDDRACSMCGRVMFFYLDDEDGMLRHDSNCHCTNFVSYPSPQTWQKIADLINDQGFIEPFLETAKKFGLDGTDKVGTRGLWAEELKRREARREVLERGEQDKKKGTSADD